MVTKTILIMVASGAMFTLWPNNSTPVMTGEAPTGTQEVTSDAEFDVIVKTRDKDTYYNDVTEELEEVASTAHTITLGAINSGTTQQFTMNSLVDGLRTYTHRIKAIHVHHNQPAQYRTDNYTAVDGAVGLLDDENVPFQHAVKINPVPQECNCPQGPG
jgi:hypothetical protein